MPGSSSRRRQGSVNYWPGFVDALAALLVVVVFLIMVFALAQAFLSDALSGRDEALGKLTRQIDELARMLDLERSANTELRLSVSQLSAQLQSSISERDALAACRNFCCCVAKVFCLISKLARFPLFVVARVRPIRPQLPIWEP